MYPPPPLPPHPRKQEVYNYVLYLISIYKETDLPNFSWHTRYYRLKNIYIIFFPMVAILWSTGKNTLKVLCIRLEHGNEIGTITRRRKVYREPIGRQREHLCPRVCLNICIVFRDRTTAYMNATAPPPTPPCTPPPKKKRKKKKKI